MRAVHCQNLVRKSTDNTEQCSRVLAGIPSVIIQALKANPNIPIILWCPRCPSSTRWAKIYANDNREIVFESGVRVDSKWPALKFDVVLNAEEA